MRVMPIESPDLPTLAARLNGLCGRAGPVTILRREPNWYESTYPSEVVACRLADGSERRLLCKYATGRGNDSHGHRGGLAYEAEVYRRVLGPLGAVTPYCYGASEGPAEGAWLVLEFIEGGVRVRHSEDPAAMPRAAEWAGRFHATAEAWLARGHRPDVRVYDAEYYGGWVRRTAEAIRPLRARLPWLDALWGRLGEITAPLLGGPPTLIHGEYYPNNILLRGEVVFPIDWESAAVAAGEIDLVSLTEDWPEETLRRCEKAYREARWPEKAPPGFERRLAAAQAYLATRWLGDDPGRPPDSADPLWYCERLRDACERLGLI